MKKILALLLCTILILCCGCTSNNQSTKIAKQYGYYSPFNTYWGMSKEECLKALGVKDSEIKEDEKTENGFSFHIERKFLGQKANVTFVFTEKDRSQGKNSGLVIVGIILQEKPKLNSILPKIQADIKKEGLTYSNPNYKLANLDLYNMKRMNSFGNTTSKNNNSEKADSMNSSNVDSIDTITLQSRELHVEQGDNPDIYTIVFCGERAAMLYHESN